MKSVIKWILLVILLIFIGCMPYSQPSLLIDTFSPTTIRTDWEKYGAYFEIDELFIEATYQNIYAPFIGYSVSPVTKVIISKRIRILTKDGSQYATVPVPRYNGTISVFRLSLLDSDGNKKSLNTQSLKSQYLKEGNIVFPNVTAGCVLDIYIAFTSYKAIVTHEHWFSEDIPVREARFTFSRTPEKFEYAFKEYGKLYQGRSKIAPTNNELTYTIWERKNVLPRSNVGYLDTYDKTEPRVAICMRYGFNKPIISTWYDISSKYQNDFIYEPYTILEDHTKDLFDTLMQRAKSDYKKADLALKWMQDNISLDGENYDDFNPDKVIKERKGTLWEIAVALKDMFKHLGLKTDIILTRPQNLGGFDESFVTPRSVGFPVVTVAIEDREYCAYPYSRGGTLGEYPQGFFGLKGVSLTDGDVVSLPPSISEKSYTKYSILIDLSEEEPAHALDIYFEGYLAYKLRSILLSSQDKDIKEVFQKILTEYDKSNALDNLKVKNLKERGKPIKAKLIFHNSDQLIERKGKKQMNLSHIFKKYFSSLDTSRTSPFSYKNELTTHEHLIIKKPEGKKVTVTVNCEVLQNDLFTSICNSSDTPESYTFNRDIAFKSCNIPAPNLGTIYKEVVKLNLIKDSYIIIE